MQRLLRRHLLSYRRLHSSSHGTNTAEQPLLCLDAKLLYAVEKQTACPRRYERGCRTIRLQNTGYHPSSHGVYRLVYSLNDNSTSDWLWNPFDFELGVIDDPIQITLTADSPTASCTIPHSAVPFVVSIQVTDIGETGLKMTVDGDDYLLQKGENRLAELLVGNQDLTLNFSGRGSLQVLFRRRVI